MIVSIVTGTYNRLQHLHNMIYSARNSIGLGMEYEIIVVDGGSTDGTLEWCKEQPDVKLIEHGELRGAVKAFNDGARASSGLYVILANDDIVFINESIMTAVAFMQDNPGVGIGCFYQDRYKQDWHVEQMPAVINGRQISAYYGQVCIVQRWLGDLVGWWGDYLRTYGGDNELSCNVLEAGYKVLPIECAQIHDTTPMDGLRKINNDNVIKRGKHPDTEAFVKHWTHANGRKGAIINSKPIPRQDVQRFRRVLYAPIYEPGYSIQKKSKRGLRDALARRMLVVECDYVAQTFDYVFDLANAFDPDLIITQIQSVDIKLNAETIRELRHEHPGAKFVNWNGDYHPEHLYSPDYIALLKQFDLNGFCTTAIQDRYEAEGVRWFYWQIGCEETNVASDKFTPCYDLLFLANGYSDDRKHLVDILRRQRFTTGLYGIWPPEYGSRGNNLYDFDGGARLYQASKLALSDSQWPDVNGYCSNRLFQAMEAGACLLQQRFAGMEELLGLVDGENIVVWDKAEDLLDRIDYYLHHDEERRTIARNAREFMRAHHSFDVRVQELLAYV